MKKIFITLILLSIPLLAQGAEIPKDIDEYLDKPVIGTPYNEALRQDIPFLLIFANPKDIASAVRFFALGEMVYTEFKNQYNFCIINSNSQNNKELMTMFEYNTLPALFIIDPKGGTYTYIEKKYYKKRELREILERFKKGTL